MAQVVPIEPRRVLREAVRWLHVRTTQMLMRRRTPLHSSRMPRWQSDLDRDYRVTIDADLVLRVSDARSGDEVAAAHLFDAVAQLHRR